LREAGRSSAFGQFHQGKGIGPRLLNIQDAHIRLGKIRR
jgi:hypothetical protein